MCVLLIHAYKYIKRNDDVVGVDIGAGIGVVSVVIVVGHVVAVKYVCRINIYSTRAPDGRGPEAPARPPLRTT